MPFTAAGVGTHQLMAVAYDGAGHHSATPHSTVTVTGMPPRWRTPDAPWFRRGETIGSYPGRLADRNDQASPSTR